jgi:acyl-CoA thioesterase
VSAPSRSSAHLHEILDRVQVDAGDDDDLPMKRGSAWVELPASWLQGRTVFGGIVGALLQRAMAGVAPSDREPRSLQVVFVAPVVPGRVEIDVQILRSGRSITHCAAQLLQGDGVRASAFGTFGAARAGRLAVEGLPAPGGPRPDDVPPMPDLPHLPAFVRHFDFRYTSPRVPFSNTPGRDLGGWCRPLGVGAVDAAALAAITDAWPGSVLPNLAAPAPASTVSWTIDFAPGMEPVTTEAWWQYAAHTEAAGDGYALSRAYVWDESGRLTVASRQVLAVFEAIKAR